MIEDIDSAYIIAKEVADSKLWMMIPFFIIAFSMVVPSLLQLSNRISEKNSRRCMVIIAIVFFSWAAIMISVLVHDHKYYDIVEQELITYVASMNCDELKEFLFWAEQEKPDWMYEAREEKLQSHYFDSCSKVELEGFEPSTSSSQS